MINPLTFDLGEAGRYQMIRHPGGNTMSIVSIDKGDVDRLGVILEDNLSLLPDLESILEIEQQRRSVNSNLVRNTTRYLVNSGIAITSVIGTCYILRQLYIFF